MKIQGFHAFLLLMGSTSVSKSLLSGTKWQKNCVKVEETKVDPKGDALLHQIMEKCWELYYYGDESKEEQNLKKQLQEIADQNKLVWKTE